MAGIKNLVTDNDLNRAAERLRLIELDGHVSRYYDGLVRFLQRNNSSLDDARDMAQETFLRMSAVEAGHIRSPGAFLFTTAHNLLRDNARSAAVRYAGAAIDEQTLVCPAPLADRILHDKEQLAVLEAALRELSPKCRAVLVLYRFDELSHREIADRLGISVSMVEKYLRKALIHCRRRLDAANSDRKGGAG